MAVKGQARWRGRSEILLTLCSFVSQGHIRDITDSLIEHCQDRKLDENANVQLSEDKVITIVFDLFGAGTCICVSFLCSGAPPCYLPNHCLCSILFRV